MTMTTEECRKILQSEDVVKPYLPRDENFLASLRLDMHARFTANKHFDAWFWAERSGRNGTVDTAIREQIGELNKTNPIAVWSLLAEAKDPLAIQALAPKINDAVQRDAAIEACVNVREPRIVGFVALQLIRHAIDEVAEQIRLYGSDPANMVIRDLVNEQLVPLSSMLRRISWQSEVETWDGISDHIVALSNTHSRGSSALWEGCLCDVFAHAIADSNEARINTMWDSQLRSSVLIAALPYAVQLTSADREFQQRLLSSFQIKIDSLLEGEPVHLFNKLITAHNLLLESVGFFLTITNDGSEISPAWLYDVLQKYDRSGEGWGASSLRYRDDCSRLSWMIAAACISIQMLKDQKRPFDKVSDKIVAFASSRLPDWMWELFFRPDTLDVMLLHLTTILPLLSQPYRDVLRQTWKLLDSQTLRQFVNLPRSPLAAEEMLELQRLIALQSSRDFPE